MIQLIFFIIMLFIIFVPLIIGLLRNKKNKGNNVVLLNIILLIINILANVIRLQYFDVKVVGSVFHMVYGIVLFLIIARSISKDSNIKENNKSFLGLLIVFLILALIGFWWLEWASLANYNFLIEPEELVHPGFYSGAIFINKTIIIAETLLFSSVLINTFIRVMFKDKENLIKEESKDDSLNS